MRNVMVSTELYRINPSNENYHQKNNNKKVTSQASCLIDASQKYANIAYIFFFAYQFKAQTKIIKRKQCMARDREWTCESEGKT